MVTLRDIADRLGCTRATVSYALKNHPGVAAATRRAVHKLARELGWKPNARLTEHMALVRGGTQRSDATLAIVINKPRAALDAEPTPLLHLRGAEQRASELGYRADVFNLAENPISPHRLQQILAARGIHIVVYIATLGTTLPLEHLEIGRAFSTSVVGVRYPEIPFDVAINDFAATGHEAVCQLQQAGYARPGAVLPRELEARLAWGFTGGIHTGQLELPKASRIPTLHVGTREIHVPETAYREILAWVAEHRPDAVLTTDPLHIAACFAALPAARRPALFSLDFHAGQSVKGGILQRQESVGAAGVDLAIAQRHRGERGIPELQRVLQIEGTWCWTGPKRPRTRATRRKPAHRH